MATKHLIIAVTEEQHRKIKEQAQIEGISIRVYILKHCGVL